MGHRLAPEARTDLDDLWFYIATNGSPENADRVVESLTKRFFLLGMHPRAGRRRDKLRAGLRAFPVSDYLVLYRIEGADAVIQRVVHGSRDLEALFDE
ncbi:MAG: type II toxin-antitoxin system RelE/ParE family toxin [Acidobacteria bacterium]|nr:type II toxin-antitoxin system RelE/ParE family toxin [Acidobacteriota bacterium]